MVHTVVAEPAKRSGGKHVKGDRWAGVKLGFTSMLVKHMPYAATIMHCRNNVEMLFR